MTINKIADLADRHNLSTKQLAAYLGVPLTVATKWRTGERVPSAAARRLIEVLSMIDVLVPEITDLLIKDN